MRKRKSVIAKENKKHNPKLFSPNRYVVSHAAMTPVFYYCFVSITVFVKALGHASPVMRFRKSKLAN